MVQKRHPPHSPGKWFRSEEFLDQTIEIWQPHSHRPLTREDAQEIATNVAGFIQALREWAREDMMKRASLSEEAAPTTSLNKAETEPSS